MKKLFSVVLAILVPALMFTACAKEEETATTTEKIEATVDSGNFTAGVYLLTGEDSRACQLQIRNENKIAIQYESKTITESGKYTVEGDVLRAKIEKNGCEYVFNIIDGSLFYDANASTPSEKFVEKTAITDGAEFYLDHTFEAR